MKRENMGWQKYFIFILLIPFSLVVIRLLAFQAGEEFQVNTYTNGDQAFPAAAMDGKGNFVITWMSREQDGSEFGVFAQMFDRNGLAIGPEFQVNTYANNNQNHAAVAMDEKGNFIVTWVCDDQDGSGKGVFARMF